MLHPLALLPPSIRVKKTDRRSSSHFPSIATNEIPASPQWKKKRFCNHFLHSYSSPQVIRSAPFFYVTHHAEGGKHMLRNPPFCTPPIASCFHPPPTSCPRIYIYWVRCKSEYAWKNIEGRRLFMSQSAWLRELSDLKRVSLLTRRTKVRQRTSEMR